MTPTAIEWPRITAGGVKDRFTLRYAYSADYQLARWGRNLASANSLELAAAMAGTFDAEGNWRSAGFDRSIDLADLMLTDEEKPIVAAVATAVNFRYPELEVKAQPIPGTTEAPMEKIADSSSGPSPSLPLVSESPAPVSGV